MVASLIGREFHRLAQLANGFRQVAGLTQHQPQRFMQRRIARLQAQRLMVFADGGGMIADGKVGSGKLRVGGNIVRLKADDAADRARERLASIPAQTPVLQGIVSDLAARTA